MRALLLSCVLSVWLVQLASTQPASEGLRQIEPINEDRQQSTLPLSQLSFLEPDDINIPVMFGFKLIQGIHLKHQECEQNRSRIESRYLAKRTRLQKYFNDTKKIISRPQFEELSNENRAAIEENFRNTFREIETEKKRKLNQMQTKCERHLKGFIHDNVQVAVRYVEQVIQQDPAQFIKITFEVTSLSLEIRKTIGWCNNPKERSNVFVVAQSMLLSVTELCQVDLTMLLSFVDQFLEKADEIYITYIDDEDLEFEFSGEGDDDYELESGDEEVDTEVVQKPTKPVKAVTTDSPRPTKPPKGHHKPHSHTGAPSTNGAEKQPTKSSPVAEEDDVTTTDELSEAELKKLVASKFLDSLEPGPVLIKDDETTVTPTTEGELDDEATTLGSFEVTPDLLVSKAFDDVNQMTKNGQGYKDTSTDSDDDTDSESDSDDDIDSETDSVTDTDSTTDSDSDSDSDSDESIDSDPETDGNEFSYDFSTPSKPKKSQSKSSNHGPQFRGSIDLDLPGVDNEIDVQIGSDGVQISDGGTQVESVVFDNDHNDDDGNGDRSRDRGHHSHHHHNNSEDDSEGSSSFVGYILTYFFVTLATLLLFAILTFAVAIAFVRLKRRSLKDTTHLTEEQKVAVMKQTGYVNPTYKFFDNVDKV